MIDGLWVRRPVRREVRMEWRSRRWFRWWKRGWRRFGAGFLLMLRSMILCERNQVSLKQTKWFFFFEGEDTHSSLFAPRYPPSPMEIAPAISSANPPNTTTLVSPSADNPAVRANGTVIPSDKPIMASDTVRPSINREEESFFWDFSWPSNPANDSISDPRWSGVWCSFSKSESESERRGA